MNESVQPEQSLDQNDANRLNSLNQALAECLQGKDEIAVLEAGGGSKSHIVFSQDKKLNITTIDISSVQLDLNTYANQKILGDIRTYQFMPESYDVIVC